MLQLSSFMLICPYTNWESFSLYLAYTYRVLIIMALHVVFTSFYLSPNIYYIILHRLKWVTQPIKGQILLSTIELFGPEKCSKRQYLIKISALALCTWNYVVQNNEHFGLILRALYAYIIIWRITRKVSYVRPQCHSSTTSLIMSFHSQGLHWQIQFLHTSPGLVDAGWQLQKMSCGTHQTAMPRHCYEGCTGCDSHMNYMTSGCALVHRGLLLTRTSWLQQVITSMLCFWAVWRRSTRIV